MSIESNVKYNHRIILPIDRCCETNIVSFHGVRDNNESDSLSHWFNPFIFQSREINLSFPSKKFCFNEAPCYLNNTTYVYIPLPLYSSKVVIIEFIIRNNHPLDFFAIVYFLLTHRFVILSIKCFIYNTIIPYKIAKVIESLNTFQTPPSKSGCTFCMSSIKSIVSFFLFYFAPSYSSWSIPSHPHVTICPSYLPAQARQCLISNSSK